METIENPVSTPGGESTSSSTNVNSNGQTSTGIQLQAADLISLVDTAIKRRLDPLVQEVRTVKKRKKEPSFKFQGNQYQHGFNHGLRDIITQAIAMIENEESLSGLALLQDAIKDIDKRNKLIRIADSSDCGWATVEEYTETGVGSDSDDDRKVRQAEDRARKKKQGTSNSNFFKQRKFRPNWSPIPNQMMPFRGPGGPTPPMFGWQPGVIDQYPRAQLTNSGPGYYPQYTVPGANQAAQQRQFTPASQRGSCHNCGAFDHWVKNCPKLK